MTEPQGSLGDLVDRLGIMDIREKTKALAFDIGKALGIPGRLQEIDDALWSMDSKQLAELGVPARLVLLSGLEKKYGSRST